MDPGPVLCNWCWVQSLKSLIFSAIASLPSSILKKFFAYLAKSGTIPHLCEASFCRLQDNIDEWKYLIVPPLRCIFNEIPNWAVFMKPHKISVSKSDPSFHPCLWGAGECVCFCQLQPSTPLEDKHYKGQTIKETITKFQRIFKLRGQTLYKTDYKGNNHTNSYFNWFFNCEDQHYILDRL